MLHRKDNVFKVASDSDLQPGASYTVTALRPGGIVASSTAGPNIGLFPSTNLTLHPGHGIVLDDLLLTSLNAGSYNVAAAVSGNVVSVLGSINVTSGDTIINLCADTGSNSPSYDGSNISIWSVPSSTATAITNSRVTANEDGEYDYYHQGTQNLWELVRGTDGVPIAVVIGAYEPNTISSDLTTTDNAIVRWDGTDGRKIQDGYTSNTPTVSDTGAVSIPGTLDVTGASTLTGNVSANGTLGVTGASTLTGGIAGGIPHNSGTWPIPTATSGTDTACTNGTAYVGSIFVSRNCTITGIQYLVGSVGGTDSVIVSLHNASGTLLANSAAAGATVGTAAQLQQVAFTATYAAVGPAHYFIALTFNGATAKFRSVPAYCNSGNGVIGNGVTQTFGTPATFTVPTTFTADKVPVASIY